MIALPGVKHSFFPESKGSIIHEAKEIVSKFNEGKMNRIKKAVEKDWEKVP